jgi:Flp pilus assembly protein TadG
MISFFRKLWRDRRGNALVIAAAALPLVIGSAGLASDTIQWALWKRQLQRAADSGAMAGVYSIVEADGDRGNVSSAVDKDLTYNSHIAYTTTKTVGAPTAGTYATDAFAVQVALSVQQRLSFSGMFMNFTPTITATSTATVVPTGHYCVISLEDQPATGIDATGSTTVNLGCGMITNSPSMSAAVATGSSSVTASPIAAVGGIPASTHWGTGTVLQPFTLEQTDPFAGVGVPSYSSCTSFPGNSAGNKPNTTVNSTTNPEIANPTGGVKCFSGDIDIQGQVTLDPGIYVIKNGDLGMTNNNAELHCTGCTFILTSDGAASDIGSFDLEGGLLDLTSPTTGTYKGITLYQDRNAPADNTNKINGNSSSKLEGALYFPKGDLEFTGTSGQDTKCMQIVTKRVSFKGNAAVNNTCPAGSGAHDFTGRKVRLVA